MCKGRARYIRCICVYKDIMCVCVKKGESLVATATLASLMLNMEVPVCTLISGENMRSTYTLTYVFQVYAGVQDC